MIGFPWSGGQIRAEDRAMPLHVSSGNDKLGRIPNVSLMPGPCGTCAPELPCYSRCYAARIAARRPNVARAWHENTELAKNDPARSFFAPLAAWYASKRTAPGRFRFHVAGDIPSRAYADGLVDFAREHPATRFLVYTKRPDMIAGLELPANLVIRLSHWPGLDYGPGVDSMPRAWYGSSNEARIPAGAFVCPGSCVTCDSCYKPEVRDIVFDPH